MSWNLSELASKLRPYWLEDTGRRVPSEGNAYDIGDGYDGTISASTTMKLLEFVAARDFEITAISCYSNGGSNDVTIEVYIDATLEISATGSGSSWTVTATFPISVTQGQVYTSQVVTTTEIDGVGYGLTGNT